MWNERNLLNSLLWEAAVDDMGIYPRSVVQDGVETQRTAWQDGWNAAVMEVTRKKAALGEWAAGLSDEHQLHLLYLLDDDAEPASVGIQDGKVEMMLRCSDTFMYACADGEPFELSDLNEICRLWKAHGYSGLIAWIAKKRRAEPVKEYRYDSRYIAAKADL